MTARTSSRRNSIIIAAGVAIALVAWLASGLITEQPGPSIDAEADRSEPMRVAVTTSRADRVTREISVSARTEPDRIVELKAETRGTVIEIGAARGERLKTGQTIANLDMRDRNASLNEIRALIKQRELEFDAARRLESQQFISAAELAATEALLVAARAEELRILLDIERTNLLAPFEATVADRFIEIGDYVDTGDSVARLVDADPLIVAGYVNERDIGRLEAGKSGTARVLGGEDLSGTIRYISPVADEATRSFRVELAIPNPDLRLPVGTSAELILGTGEITAHDLPTSLLTLADDGTVGVKAVDDSNRVRFYPVETAGSTQNGVLITGLPPTIRLIVVGQGFVVEGQTVIPEPADSLPQ
jgi:multidrug efflux system membrane fusion protein